MVNLTPQQVALTVGRTVCFTSCWKVTRVDGTTLCFTDHNKSLVFDGLTYEPGYSATASARQRVLGSDPQNLELKGFITSNKITDTDIRSGLYRNAMVTEFVVDWRFPDAGAYAINVFYIDNVKWDLDHWVAQLSGQKMRLNARVGDLYTRNCRYILGDSRCGVSLAGLTVTSSVSSVVKPKLRIATPLAQAAGYFDNAVLTFTSGLNNGYKSVVKSHASGQLEFQVRTAHAISAGDAFSIAPGCDLNEETCKTKFNNFNNFGGFPTIPGTNKTFKTPDIKQPQ
jgi:uncharacterized phage protein (TIGR02218 family)